MAKAQSVRQREATNVQLNRLFQKGVFVTLGTVTLLSWVGCVSPDYRYAPVAQTETIAIGERGATFPVRIDQGSGKLRIMSLGIVEVHIKQKPPVHAIHLRLIVTHEKGSDTWNLPIALQQVEIDGGKKSVPAFLQTEEKDAPDIHIAPGAMRRIELFYPLPKLENAPTTLTGFIFHWNITSAQGHDQADVPFSRYVANQGNQASDQSNYPGWHQNMVLEEEQMGGPWWYGSAYPNPAMPFWNNPMFPSFGFPGAFF